MNYFDIYVNQVKTEGLLKLEQIPLDNKDRLIQMGYIPIEYAYPNYNKDIEYILPAGDPHPKNGDPKQYIQDFNIVPLDESELEISLERKVQERRNELFKAADKVVEPINDQFSDLERQTWPNQQLEVEAYRKDSTASTPYLDLLANKRGITREEQIAKATAKVDAFIPISSHVIGQQQGYEDQIKSIAQDTSKSIKQRILDLSALEFTFALE